MASREERLAANEDFFRHVNEHIVEFTDKWGGELDVVCECAHTDCAERLELTLDEYELLRKSPHRFAVLPGHEIPDVEDVVERGDRFLVVEKHGKARPLVEERDPRS